VELARDCAQPDDVIRERLEAAARADLRVSAEVRVLDFGALPRTEGKTRRVVRSVQ
jgi:phenylacetate-coenzyme A ligase PaaK-like adenylate-forming protein